MTDGIGKSTLPMQSGRNSPGNWVKRMGMAAVEVSSKAVGVIMAGILA